MVQIHGVSMGVEHSSDRMCLLAYLSVSVCGNKNKKEPDKDT
jgi:hypothetical protein